MGTIRDRAEALSEALSTVDGARVYTDPAATIDPPGIVLGPPALFWESGCLQPTSARFLVYVVETNDDRAIERLWDLVPQVSAVVDLLPSAAVITANPGTYTSGGTELPAYLIQVEVNL